MVQLHKHLFSKEVMASDSLRTDIFLTIYSKTNVIIVFEKNPSCNRTIADRRIRQHALANEISRPT